MGGQGNHLIDRGLPANHDRQLAQRYSFLAKEQTQSGEKLPPLKASVEPIKQTEGTFLFAGEEIDVNSDSTMPVTKFTRASLGAKFNKQDRTYTLSKDNFNDCLEEIKKLQELNGNLKGKVRDLEDKVAHLEAIAKKKPNSSKSNRKHEQNEDVVKAVCDYVRDVLFRNVKFAPPGAQLKSACKMVWAGIRDKLKLDKGPSPLSEKDFEEIYASAVLTALSGRRQYVQTRAEIAAKGEKCCALPVVSV